MLTSSAHLAPEQRGMETNGTNGSVGGKNPLAGLVPRKVTVAQAKAIMVS